MKKMAKTSINDEPSFVPAEMISVVALTDHYVYSGDLMATVAMTENIMQTTKFCSTNLLDFPSLEKELKNQGIPVLFLEGERDLVNLSQLKTRIQAFIEMLV